jgi:hypothetical protein
MELTFPDVTVEPLLRKKNMQLQKVVDDTGERFIILVEGADRSKPLTESEARIALRKMGNSPAVIQSMFDHARNVFCAEPHG